METLYDMVKAGLEEAIAYERGEIDADTQTLSVPTAETIAAMMEADAIARDPKTKRYASFKELLAEVEAD